LGDGWWGYGIRRETRGQGGTFNIQRSTFNVQVKTKNKEQAQPEQEAFNIQRSTLNAQVKTKNKPNRSSQQQPHFHPALTYYALRITHYVLRITYYALRITPLLRLPHEHISFRRYFHMEIIDAQIF
jgi:nitrate/nitrite-specific signal transduction histidine kinase